MQTFCKPMTAREKAELRGLISPTTTGLRIGLFLVAVLTLGWILRWLQMVVSGSVGRFVDAPLWLVPTVLLAGYFYVRGGRWTGGRGLRDQIRRELDRGEMAVHRIRVTGALEAPEIEDEGPVFFVRDEDGVTLFFSGQEMARHKSGGFPWREIQVRTTPESALLVRLRARAGPFPDVEVRPPLSLAEARELGVMSARFGTVDKSLEELIRPGTDPSGGDAS